MGGVQRDGEGAEASVMSIGATLRRTRLGHGASLEKVARHLGVDGELLHALEEGTIAEVCSDLQVRAYVRLYARFLGYDAEGILRGEPAVDPADDAEIVAIAAELAAPARPKHLAPPTPAGPPPAPVPPPAPAAPPAPPQAEPLRDPSPPYWVADDGDVDGPPDTQLARLILRTRVAPDSMEARNGS
jgi:transcriptional regulator with XRE-family HTH domain